MLNSYSGFPTHVHKFEWLFCTETLVLNVDIYDFFIQIQITSNYVRRCQ